MGDDEAAEGGIEFVFCGGGGVLAEETPVGAAEVLVREFLVFGVLLLPIGETGRVGHLDLTLLDCFGESGDRFFPAIRQWSFIWVLDGIGMHSPVARTHDDSLIST